MLSLPSAVRILIWTQPIDMRKGFSALTTLVASVDEDPYSGHLYVFVSRRRDQLRILTWQRGGFVLLCKRLSQGVFPLPVGAGARQEVDGATLAMLLEGIDVAKVKRPRHWVPASRTA